MVHVTPGITKSGHSFHDVFIKIEAHYVYGIHCIISWPIDASVSCIMYDVLCSLVPHCWAHHYYLYAFISKGMGMPPSPHLILCNPT